MKPVERWLTALMVGLAIPAHLIGLLVPSIYRDPVVLLPQNLGTDLVTLGVVVPLLAIAGFAQRHGSLRARLLWLGALGYLVYAYGMYALAVRWTPLFLVYTALFGLSLYAVIIGLIGTDAAAVWLALTVRAPRRSVATYLLAVAMVVAAVWLKEEIAATLRGAVPASVVQFETPTNIVHVFDLAIVLPAFMIAAILLLRRRPWGYLLSGMLLVKAATIGLWVVAMIWFSAREGISTPVAYTALFATLTVMGAGLAWQFLRSGNGKRETVGAVPARRSLKGAAVP